MVEIIRVRGDTTPDVVVIQQADGTPLNITGYTIVMTIHRRENPTLTQAPLLVLNGVITDAVNGKVAFMMTLPQANLLIGTLYFDIQLTDTSGFIRTAVKGHYKVVQDITKPPG